MFWADRIAKEIQKEKGGLSRPLIIRDEKTLSGRVHVGSMRGLAIHALVAEVLDEYGIKNTFLWEHNDFDPFDSIPPQLDESVYREHLGKPLYLVPSPEPGYDNYAEFYGAEFEGVHRKFGATPSYYRAYRDLYGAGKMDAQIRTALDRVSDIRRILKEVSGSVKDESWLPVSVVCEKCKKMMTTRAYDWDGETVAYTCERTPDECVPCGHEGRVAPFSGAAKLFWKVEWAAKWVAMGVDVEGGGKDHSTKGGARDVANHIAREVFGIDSPFDIPYEFFLVGGKKMSSSKGRGSSAKDMSELFTPELFRLLLIGKEPMQQIDVDPEGDSVPRMYDWYDDLAQMVREGIADDFTRLYALAQLPEDQAEISAPWQLRFSQLSFIVQMPHMDLITEAARIKGAVLTQEEETKLSERAGYARFWLEMYAPESARYVLQEVVPTVSFSEAQKAAFKALMTFVDEERTGEEVHAFLHALKTDIPISPKELFSGIYELFLGRTSGPKAGWFLSVLPRDYVLNRLKKGSA
ncbi:MAG TPA: lysine--tRNA ligase [Candidatus Paceibacterota bacterium]|nr:lysine--tRNA ligase [Candidatus Paceibacterota bacterium]